MADSLSDPILSPEQYQQQQQAIAEVEHPATFTPDVAGATAAATAKFDPYRTALFDELTNLEKRQVEKTNLTYDDLLKNLTESYNSRGRFFSGEALAGEQKINTQRASALSDVASTFSGRRAAVAEDTQKNISAETQQTLDRQYQDFLNTRSATIQKEVMSKLSEYIPKFASEVQKQLNDPSQFYFDIPLGDVVQEESPRKKYESQGWRYIGTMDEVKRRIREGKTVRQMEGSYFYR